MSNTQTSQDHTQRCDECDSKDSRNCKLSADAAENAVKKVFAILGVNIDNPESVEEFRADLRFGKKMRKTADYGTMAFIGIVATGMAAALWAGIVSKINGGNG